MKNLTAIALLMLFPVLYLIVKWDDKKHLKALKK